MSRNTGLLTEWCDCYGSESEVQLAGGLFDPSMNGNIHWKCGNRASGRFRLVCVGGEYGSRVAPDGGRVAAYNCPGGHEGQPMALCDVHQRQLSIGPRKPGFDSSGRPYGIVGGTGRPEACPACLAGRSTVPEVRRLMYEADQLQQEISHYHVAGLGLVVPKDLVHKAADISRRLDELNATGQAHKCPLRLVEVS